MIKVYLKPGRESSIKRKHPWLFSGAIARIEGEYNAGDSVSIFDSRGSFLAQGAISPESNILIRVFSFDEVVEIDKQFFRQQVNKAKHLRDALPSLKNTNAYRLVNGESDGLPGLIVDRYKDVLLVQFLFTGVEKWKSEIIDILAEVEGCTDIYERSDEDVRKLEGLPLNKGWLRGGRQDVLTEIQENSVNYWVDYVDGHKTGFYLDQRENRLKVTTQAAGRKVLNCFCYSGAFSVCAQLGGAGSITSVDSSAPALELAQKNWAENCPDKTAEWIQSDVFQFLRTQRDRSETFDMIILDPPKFARTASQVQRAARGYKDINLLAFKLLKPGGLLFTFSCSGGLSTDLFQKIVADAALDAGVHAAIIDTMRQAEDHPVALNIPEAAYLKGLICRVG